MARKIVPHAAVLRLHGVHYAGGPLWDNTAIQAIRLVAEMHAAMDPAAYARLMPALATSMDLDARSIMDLVDRVSDAWEAIKAVPR